MADLIMAALWALVALPVVLMAVTVWAVIEVHGCDWRSAWKSVNKPF